MRKSGQFNPFILETGMSRALYLVCYDVTDARRRQRVHRYVQAYAIGGQKSFYECWLTPSEYFALKRALADNIVDAEDRIHIFQLDPRIAPSFYGQAKRQSVRPFMIV